MDCGLFRSADGRFGFRHALLREAALADLDDARRALAARGARRRPRRRAAEAARHLRLAGRDDLAVARLVQAAADAAQATALVEAVAYLAGGDRAAAGRPADPRWSSPARSRSSAAATPRWRRSTPRCELLRPDDAAARVHAHLERGAVVPQRAVRPARAPCAAAQRRRSTPTRRAASTTASCCGEMLADPRRGARSTIGGAERRRRHARRARRARARPETPSLRRHYLDTVRGFDAARRGTPRARRRRCWSPPATPASAPAARTCAYGGWANAACIAARRRPPRAGARATPTAGARASAGLPTLEFQTTRLVAYALARLGRHDEARAAFDRQYELAARLALARSSPRSPSTTRACSRCCAGDHERAAELLGRALEGDAAGAARRGAAARAPRRSRGSAAPTRPTPRSAPPRSSRCAPPTARRCSSRGWRSPRRWRARARRPRARRAAAARGRGASGGGSAGQDDASREHLASLVDLGRPPVDRRRRPGRRARARRPRNCRGLEAHAHVR